MHRKKELIDEMYFVNDLNGINCKDVSRVKIIDLQCKEHIFTDRDNSEIIAPTVGFETV